MGKPNVWVVRDKDGWAVKHEGGKASSHHETQAAAIAKGRTVAMREKVELIWQGRDGSIKGRNSYGNDPRGKG